MQYICLVGCRYPSLHGYVFVCLVLTKCSNTVGNTNNKMKNSPSNLPTYLDSVNAEICEKFSNL